MSSTESSEFTPTDSDESITESETETETESTITSDSDRSGSSSSSKKKKGSTRKVDQNDPFQKKVPESFYAKEEKNLGKLESHWEIGYKGNKKYFVDHRNKTTTWVDPRTKSTRVMDPQNCQMGELPYGWEEDVDEEIGVYYIDHNTQSTFLDPPWDPRVKFQVAQLSKFIRQQVSQLENALNEETVEKSALDIIEEEKRDLLKQIELLKNSSHSESESDLTSSDFDSDEDVEPPKTVEEFKERLADLMNMANLLASRPGGLEEAKQTNEEILRVQRMLEEEERVRKQLEDDIRKLKDSLNEPYNVAPAPIERSETEGSISSTAGVEYDQDGAPKIKRKAILTRKTKYEMGVELLLLKKKVEEEKQRQKRIEELKKVEDEPEREGNRPNWLKKLEAVASSKTLKVKINMKQQSAPDQLSFRERMLFFAANSAKKK